MRKSFFLFPVIAIFLMGCETFYESPQELPMPHIHNTQVMTEIVSEPPGARIEINNQYVGITPITLHIYRTFSSYVGWDRFTISAYPIYAGQTVQRKFIQLNEVTPTKVFFDMNLVPIGNEINVNINR